MQRPIAFSAPSVLAFAAAALLLGGAPVSAQPPPAQAPSNLEEIVVTARYREESLQETPIAITALTADEIAVRGFSSGYEVAYTVPNATFRQTQAAFGNTMSSFIRGIGQNDFLSEFEPGVGVYFDDVLHPVTLGSSIDLLDLERIEVLRGPQGTLFGRGSIGGALRYVSKIPQGDDTGTIQVTYGDYDRVDVRASYDFSLSDRVSARVTGLSKQREGYQTVLDFACVNPTLAGTIPTKIPNRLKGCELGTQGGEDVVGGRAALRIEASEDVELLLTADYQNDSSEARADSLVNISPLTPAFANWSQNYLVPTYGVPFDNRFIPSDVYTTYATFEDPRSGLVFTPQTAVLQQGLSAKLDWDIGENLNLALIASDRDFESNFATDADQSPINEQLVDGRSEFDSSTFEARFSGRIADSVDWTVGAFYYDGEFQTAQTVSLPAFIFDAVYGGAIAGGAPPNVAAGIAAGVIDGPARFLVNALNITESENTSVFAHFVWDMTDRLALTFGGRYSEDKKDEDFDNTIVQALLFTDESHSDWKLGVDYNFSDNVLGYISAATGYRPQAFNPRPFQYTQFVKVDGEEATSYELGLKGDFFDQRLRLNVAAFSIDYSQRIIGVAGTECLVSANPPPIYTPDDPNNPNSVTDTLGNVCDSVTSRTFYQNAPGDVTGAELEFTFRPTDALTLSGIYGLTGWSSDDIDNAASVFGPNFPPIITDRPVYVPETNWSFAIAYAFAMGGGATLTPRLDVYGQTEICTSTISTLACAPGYELVNARLEWTNPDGSWRVAGGVNNATDEEYFLNLFDLSPFGQPTTEGQPGRPEEWYLSFTREF